MKIIIILSVVFTGLFIVNVHAISFGFKTCSSPESETDEAVTLTIYEGNKMFQCEIPSANEISKVYKCSDNPTGNDEIAFECRSADTDKYGMLITVPPSDNSQSFGVDDVCINSLIVNGPIEYDTQDAYIGDGFLGFSFMHSRYYDFNGAKPSQSNSGPFTNAVVYEGIPTCFEECNVLSPPPSQCTTFGKGPAQADMDAGTQYCKHNGCVLVSIHCNHGALNNGVFTPNPLPCTPTCGDTVPPGGPFVTATAAHTGLSAGIDDDDRNNEELMKQFYEMKNEMEMNNIMLMVCFTIIAFIISCSMICAYHKIRNSKSNKNNI